MFLHTEMFITAFSACQNNQTPNSVNGIGLQNHFEYILREQYYALILLLQTQVGSS